MIRHTKGQTRNGAQLLELRPLSVGHSLVHPSEAERAAYDAARDEARAAIAAGGYRLHEHAQLLRPLMEVAAGLLGDLGEKSQRMRDAGLQWPGVSELPTLFRSIEPRLPRYRDDFRVTAEEVPNDALTAWRGSLDVHEELSCVGCLGPLSSAAAPITCGHLMCSGCAEEMLGQSAAERGDVVAREMIGVRISGQAARLL